MMNVEFAMVIIAHVQIVLERQMAQHIQMNVELVILIVLMIVYKIVQVIGVAA
jgi:hypothetical protein